MKEEDKQLHEKPKVAFGQPLKQQQRQSMLFPDGDDLPLFSGTPQNAIDRPYMPEDQTFKQQVFPDMPEIDYERIRIQDNERKRRRSHNRRVTNARSIFPLPE